MFIKQEMQHMQHGEARFPHGGSDSVLYRDVSHDIVLYRIAPQCIVLWRIIYGIVVYWIVFYCIVKFGHMQVSDNSVFMKKKTNNKMINIYLINMQ